MKPRILLLSVLMVAVFIACKKDDNSTPESLGIITEKLQMSLDSLNDRMASASTSLAGSGADSALVRSKLQQLFSEIYYAKELAFVNASGIMSIIEPPAYYSFQGYSFSSDAAMMGLIQNHQNAFANYFNAYEGFAAVADMHAVFSGANCYGLIEVLFDPWDYIDGIVSPLVDAPDEIFVMEKSGAAIYDVDLPGIAKNVFTDPYYNVFPEFVAACQKIAAEDSGETTYSFYSTGTTTLVSKRAWWKTITLHDNAWKVVWVEED
ncbi:MAG: hypothetical protein AB9842_02740 [Bacteroidales bacterium]